MDPYLTIVGTLTALAGWLAWPVITQRRHRQLMITLMLCLPMTIGYYLYVGSRHRLAQHRAAQSHRARVRWEHDVAWWQHSVRFWQDRRYSPVPAERDLADSMLRYLDDPGRPAYWTPSGAGWARTP